VPAETSPLVTDLPTPESSNRGPSRVTAARAAGAAREIIVRGDAAFYAAKLISTCRRARVRLSVTVPITRAIRAAIVTIDESAWVDIRYPHAIFDEHEGRSISDAQIAQTSYTAFAPTWAN
jgi:hypothetical protein